MPEPLFDSNKSNIQKPSEENVPEASKDKPVHPLTDLQQKIGNRAVQRLIQRSGEESSEIDDETAGKINANRGGGQSLDSSTQERMGSSMGYDFSDVRVHTSSESNDLNKEVGAKAFTTGSDIFFSDGAYDPGSTGGQELLAHELTHVVQQGTGSASGSGSGMTVNEPNDSFEQEADSVAKSVITGPANAVQAQEEEEYAMTKREDHAQRQDEEEYAMTKREDHAQRQEDEEEYAMTKREDLAQRQEDEEEYAMTKREDLAQRQDEEEYAMTKREDLAQMQEEPEEEEEILQPQPIEEEEEEMMP